MRREGYIIEEIIEYSNMSEAFDAVLRGTDRKESTQGEKLLARREKVISELTGKRKGRNVSVPDWSAIRICNY